MQRLSESEDSPLSPVSQQSSHRPHNRLKRRLFSATSATITNASASHSTLQNTSNSFLGRSETSLFDYSAPLPSEQQHSHTPTTIEDVKLPKRKKVFADKGNYPLLQDSSNAQLRIVASQSKLNDAQKEEEEEQGKTRQPNRGIITYANYQRLQRNSKNRLFHCEYLNSYSDRKKLLSTVYHKHKFQGFHLRSEFDIKPILSSLSLSYQNSLDRQGLTVTEILSARYKDREYVFCLFRNGLGVVFDRKTTKYVAVLNSVSDEVIRSLFYNRKCNSIVTVTVYISEQCLDLYCKSVHLEYVSRMDNASSNVGKINYLKQGFRIFETECLRWPGFVEFDEVNEKVVTYNAESRIYKIWELCNYRLLYSLNDCNIQELKVSPSVMLLIFCETKSVQQKETVLPLHVLDINTGETLVKLHHTIESGKDSQAIEFVDLFNGKILLKQKNCCLKIIDIKTGQRITIKETENVSPAGFLFLYSTNLFLAFEAQKVTVWDFIGNKVSKFEETIFQTQQPEAAATPACTALSALCVSQDQKYLFSYSQQQLHISEIRTGRVVATISSTKGKQKFSHQNYEHWMKQTKRKKEALKAVSTVYYDELTNEIYTGSEQGKVFIWSN